MSFSLMPGDSKNGYRKSRLTVTFHPKKLLALHGASKMIQSSLKANFAKQSRF